LQVLSTRQGVWGRQVGQLSSHLGQTVCVRVSVCILHRTELTNFDLNLAQVSADHLAARVLDVAANLRVFRPRAIASSDKELTPPGALRQRKAAV
jgi:hypothetical protein